MKLSLLDRLLLLGMVLLAAYQIVVGIDPLPTGPIVAYTVAFGVLLVAGLLIFILGFDALDTPVVVVISTIIPLSLALGLIWDRLPGLRAPGLVGAALGLAAVLFSRSASVSPAARTLILAFVHGVAGLAIFALPIFMSVQHEVHPAFALVGLGGALIGTGGLMLTFLRAGRPLLTRELTLRIFPALLFLTTACFVLGFNLG
ncbi:MAG TPA: hypothetical protein VIU39_00915 [Anaerolineales bacterium]